MKNVLTIAGSDCSGGAGIQADLKTFAACGVYGMSALTALTAQNTQGVQAIHEVRADFIGEQLDSIFGDIPVHAVKVGMLPNPEAMRVVAERLTRYAPAWIVVDPVMVSKSGHALMNPDSVSVFIETILPLASVVTPNRPEVEALTQIDPRSRPDLEQAARWLLSAGAHAVLVKGGHCEGPADDVLVTPEGLMLFSGERLSALHTHGTGCSLSSAIASFLALGFDLPASVGRAKTYVAEGIRHARPLGKGIGPIHHFWNYWPSAKESLR